LATTTTTDDGMRRGDDGIGDRSTALRGGRGRRWTSRLRRCAIVPLLLMLLLCVGLSHGSDQSPRSTGK